MRTTVLSYEGGILWGTARVRFSPNWMERRFGFTEKVKEYEWEGTTYRFGGEREWIDPETGKIIGRIPKIDNYIRKVKYNTRVTEQVVKEYEDRSLYDTFASLGETTLELQTLLGKKKQNERQ